MFKQLRSSAVSALAVIGLIGALLLVFGQRVDRVEQLEAERAGAQQPAGQQLVAGEAPIPVAPGPDDHMGAEPGPLVPRGSVPDPTTLAEDPKGSFTEAEIAGAAKGPVVLFNQTYNTKRVDGLKAALTAAGWTVPATDTWHGAVPATTVYFPKGMELQARALMAAFPSISRIRPAFSGIPSDKLTVILTGDFPILP
ncbi:MAG: LytR C-terminal domain-containing protein [Sporichthyaceae bacterium]